MCDVNLVTGEVSQFATDVFLPGIIPFHFIRTYSTTLIEDGPIGHGWRHSLQMSAVLTGSSLTFVNGDGQTIDYPAPVTDAPVRDEESGSTVTRGPDGLTITEADGNRLVFSPLDRSGRAWVLAYKEDAYGNRLVFAYDPQGRVSGLLDTIGRVVRFDYDRRGHLVRIDMRPTRGSETTLPLVAYEYDEDGDLVAVFDRSGTPCRYRYQDHLVTTVVNRIGGQLYYQYDRERRCVKTWRDGAVLYREMHYHPGRRMTAVVNSRGHMTIYKYNTKGLVEDQIDALGRVKRDVYNADGELILSNSEAGAIAEVTTYNTETRTLTVARPSGTTIFVLDQLGNPVSVTSPSGDTELYEYDHGGSLIRSVSALEAEWRFAYDERGYLVRSINPLGYEVRKVRTFNPITITEEDDLGLLSRRSFDAYGKLIASQDGKGRRTEVDYDPAGQPTRIRYPDGTTTVSVYDREANLLSETDETGLTTSYTYDSNSRLIEIVDPEGRRLRFEYDTEDNIVAVTNCKGERAEYAYDEVNRQTRVRSFDGQVELYEYDDDDNLVRIRDGSGEAIASFGYDDVGRVIRKTWADGNTTTVAYGPHNEILSLENAEVRLQYEWDVEMRLVKEQVGDVVLEFDYDPCGNRVALRSSTGRRIRYEWDPRGRLTRLTDDTRAGSFTYEYTHDLTNLVEQCRFPNGLVERFAYDRVDRMVHRTVSRTDGTLLTDRRFEYDGATRLIGMADRQRGTFQYRYDAGDRLLQVVKNRQLAEQYAYDADDNLLSLADGSRVTVAAGDRVVRAGREAYAYDRFGNMIERAQNGQRTRYEYNLEAELVGAATSAGRTWGFRYDPLGRRIAKIEADTRSSYLWDGLSPLEERTDTGDVTEYLFLPGSFFPVGHTRAGQHYSCSFDQLGTPTELFDPAGGMAWTVEHTAFGEIRSAEPGALWYPFRFQGQYADEGLGLSYTRYRYYDPRLGRFTTPDPIGLKGGINQYRYGPNPLNWIDPFGLFVCDVKPKCSWSQKQMKDAHKKEAEMNKKLKDPPAPASACQRTKTAKEIYEECRNNGHPLPPLKETSSKCSNQQADHIRELQAGGTNDCKNLQPLNESVNKSFGSQIKACLKNNPGASITKLKLLPQKPGTCREGGRKCPD